MRAAVSSGLSISARWIASQRPMSLARFKKGTKSLLSLTEGLPNAGAGDVTAAPSRGPPLPEAGGERKRDVPLKSTPTM